MHSWRGGPFATLARRMRAPLIALAVVAAAAVLAATSGADTPARARAQVSVVSGSLGDFGTLMARGDDEQADELGRRRHAGVVVKIGRRPSPAPRAPAAPPPPAPPASPATIDLLRRPRDRLRARAAPPPPRDGETVRSGRVAGLTLEGRRVGDVRRRPRLPRSPTAAASPSTAAPPRSR